MQRRMISAGDSVFRALRNMAGQRIGGEGTRIVPIPLVSYNGEKFYFRGISAGWRFISSRLILPTWYFNACTLSVPNSS